MGTETGGAGGGGGPSSIPFILRGKDGSHITAGKSGDNKDNKEEDKKKNVNPLVSVVSGAGMLYFVVFVFMYICVCVVVVFLQ